MSDLARLARRASTQYGLLTTEHLERLGVDRSGRSRLLRRGAIERRGRRLYAMAGAARSWESDVLAACLVAPGPAAASHRTALRLWGLRSVDDEVEVTVRYPNDLRRAGVVVHRSVDIEPCDRTWIEGIPVTVPARTLCDAGLVFPEQEVRRLVQSAVGLGVVTVAELWAFRRRVAEHGRTGVIALEDAIGGTGVDVGGESGPELEVLRLLVDGGLPRPVSQHLVVVHGRRYRLDLAYPDERIAIEFDGYLPHIDAAQFSRDRERQNRLVLAGWTVLRFTGADLRDRPWTVAATVRRTLAPTHL